MVKIRTSQSDESPKRRRKPEPASEVTITETDDEVIEERKPDKPKEKPAGPRVRGARGMSERQWFIGLLVASALLILITFRGCILPSGVGPKQEPAGQPTARSTPAAESTSGSGISEYTVQPGDNLGKIAQKTGVSIDAIAEANGISRTTILRVGQKLKIP